MNFAGSRKPTLTGNLILAILVKRGSEFNTIGWDDSGRCLLIKVTNDAESYVLGNVYAPTQDHVGDQMNTANFLEDSVLE